MYFSSSNKQQQAVDAKKRCFFAHCDSKLASEWLKRTAKQLHITQNKFRVLFFFSRLAYFTS